MTDDGITELRINLDRIRCILVDVDQFRSVRDLARGYVQAMGCGATPENMCFVLDKKLARQLGDDIEAFVAKPAVDS